MLRGCLLLFLVLCLCVCVSAQWLRAQERIQAQVAVLERKCVCLCVRVKRCLNCAVARVREKQTKLTHVLSRLLTDQARQLTALKVHLGQASVIAAALDRILSLVSSPVCTLCPAVSASF